VEVAILHQSFAKGTPPKGLDGFYKGKLIKLLPNSSGFEQSVNLLVKLWLPWYGKEFIKKTQRGNNLLPSYLLPIIRARYGSDAIVGRDELGMHVFPFQTKITKGLNDKINVLQLNYDLQENPDAIRTVVDELVEIGDKKYLGKAYLKEGKSYRLVAFFGLEK
jgi:hypothetical protein